jgi:thiamine-phosphate pyrophosphorylase
MNPILRGLYAITPDWNDTARLVATTEAILLGGCRIVQYRNKTASPCHRDEQAVALRGLTRRHGALLIVNDDLELALAVAADGVHLGADDGDLAAARTRLGSDRILGASCYQSTATADLAARAGADYIAFGSFFASPTKPHAGRAELDLIGATKRSWNLPVCAIGGITLDNAPALIDAGADLLAVISAVYNSPAPERASRAFSQLFETQRP